MPYLNVEVTRTEPFPSVRDRYIPSSVIFAVGLNFNKTNNPHHFHCDKYAQVLALGKVFWPSIIIARKLIDYPMYRGRLLAYPENTIVGQNAFS
jgi:hypothetical protein